MEINDVLAIAGMPGLYKKIGQHKNGLIVESLDGTGKKFPTSATTKVSMIADIAMFTIDGEEKLAKIFLSINDKEKDGLVVPDKKADDKSFTAFLGTVLPNYDNERIYLSDMKKLANWYNLLKGNLNFESIKKSLEEETEESKAEEKAKAETKAKVEKVVKNTNVKSDTKSKGKSVGTIRKMA